MEEGDVGGEVVDTGRGFTDRPPDVCHYANGTCRF